jgi:hypothetical protein
MTVTIRKLEHHDHEYFAYAKSLCGKATYFVYFTDDVWGAVILHNFVEMLRSFFQPSQVTVRVGDKSLSLKDETLLEYLKDSTS